MMSKEKEPVTRVYTIPLRRIWIAPRHVRAKRAIGEIRDFAKKHMKSSEVTIAPELSELVWGRGIQNPPRRVTVKMERDEKGAVEVSLSGAEGGKD